MTIDFKKVTNQILYLHLLKTFLQLLTYSRLKEYAAKDPETSSIPFTMTQKKYRNRKRSENKISSFTLN